MVKVINDVIYDATHNLATDLYFPEAADNKQPLNVVLVIHGGGWKKKKKSKDSDLGQYWASQGYLAVVPDYRQTPTAYFPAPLDDMTTVLEWLKTIDYGVTLGKIGVFGSSVGGNMAVEVSIKHGLPAVSLSGILDIDSWLENNPDVVPEKSQNTSLAGASAEINQTGKDEGFYKWFILNYLEDRPGNFFAATPVHRVNAQTGHMYLANSLDEFVPSSGVLALSQKLVENNIPHQVRFIAGSKHAKGYLEKVKDEVTKFMAEELQ